MKNNRIIIATTTVAFLTLSLIAKERKKEYTYENEPDERNPYESKKVEFVPDDNYGTNADGEKGYLKVIGETTSVNSIYERSAKRLLDKVLSFCGLVVMAPVFALISAAIVIDDPGPIIFTQKRVGKDKAFFKLHKFRSMKTSTPHETPTHMLNDPDLYITRVGRFIRKHSLDELPQIWDIFVGTMSIIGPRPALWNQDVLVAERDKYRANDVSPGLTGWAQINGRDEISISEKAKADGEYVASICKGMSAGVRMDIKCFIYTCSSVLKSEGVVEGANNELP